MKVVKMTLSNTTNRFRSAANIAVAASLCSTGAVQEPTAIFGGAA
ncbi:hypothetical protein O4H61_01395 [Roseovarius aestuarii]|nr:hypothetical protein [Roseovarius aestuarii]